MDALQKVFRAVDATARDGYILQDLPPWEDRPVTLTHMKPVEPPKPPPPPKPENSNLSDSEGLQKAYESPDNTFVDGNRMYIAGTTPSPFGKDLKSTVRNTENFIQDWTDNITKLPFNLTQGTTRYQQAFRTLAKNPQVTTLIGHSLGGNVANELMRSSGGAYKSRTYSAPVFRWDLPSDENHLRFRTEGDPVAIMDRWAIPVHKDSWNPLSLHSFGNFGDIGKKPTPGGMPVSWIM